MKKATHFLINLLADSPILLSLPFQIITKINLKIIDFFVSISSFLHVKFNTETGKQIVELNAKMKKMAQIAKAMEASIEASKQKDKSKVKTGSKLFDTIMGDDDDDSGQTFH